MLIALWELGHMKKLMSLNDSYLLITTYYMENNCSFIICKQLLYLYPSVREIRVFSCSKIEVIIFILAPEFEVIRTQGFLKHGYNSTFITYFITFMPLYQDIKYYDGILIPFNPITITRYKHKWFNKICIFMKTIGFLEDVVLLLWIYTYVLSHITIADFIFGDILAFPKTLPEL